MMDVLLFIIIVIASALIVLVLLMLTLWRKKIEHKLKRKFVRNDYAFFIQLIIGITTVLAAVLIAFDGDIWGESTLGIARFIGACGLCLIISSFFRYIPHNRILP
jgi:predicted membrane channel-forming protein YqfA (hemolysin III family)